MSGAQGRLKMADKCSASLTRRPQLAGGLGFDGVFDVICYNPVGDIKWREQIHNLVVNSGLDLALQRLFPTIASPQVSDPTWYVGLVDGSTSPEPSFAAADTMSSHSGWSEFTDYLQSPDVRPAYQFGALSSQSLNNSSNRAQFSVNQDSSIIAGAFLVANDNARGGTSGILLSAGAFTGGNKGADNGDTLSVSYTFSASDV